MNIADLKKMLIEFGRTLDPPFVADNSLRGSGQRGYAVIKRSIKPGQWQYLAIVRHPMMSQFDLEVALSPVDKFPVECLPIGPDFPGHPPGVEYFRASHLWKYSVDGWLVNDRHPVEFAISYYMDGIKKFGFEAQGVFDSAEEAMEDVKMKVLKWVLPYLDKAA